MQNDKHNDRNPDKKEIEILGELLIKKEFKKLSEVIFSFLKKYPDSPVLYNIKGILYLNLKSYNIAIESFAQSINLHPEYIEAINNMGITFHEMGDYFAAIESFDSAINIKENYADAHTNKGITLQDKGDLKQAIDSHNSAIKYDPEHPEAHMNLGICFQKLEKNRAALKSYKKALKITPKIPEIYNNIGVLLKSNNDLDGALKQFNVALNLNPQYAEAYNNKGNVLRAKGDYRAAIKHYNSAINIEPNYAEAFNNWGNSLKEIGEFQEAVVCYEKALKCNSGHIDALINLCSIKTFHTKDRHIEQIKNIYMKHDKNTEYSSKISFVLAKVYEDLGEIKSAVSYFKEGNRIKKELTKYRIEFDREIFSILKNNSNNLMNLKIEKSKIEKTIKPIFILGMPRSGTTVVEQIISSHSMVYGAGELNYIHKLGSEIALNNNYSDKKGLIKFREEYLKHLMDISNCYPYVTDKMPQNFKYIGLILNAFPEAIIIHVKRNPEAICWSNFKHNFTTKGLDYSNDLDDIIKYYFLYRDMMKFWEIHYPKTIYHIDYDLLTINQENETRKLINFIGLKWERSCLYPEKNNRVVLTASQVQVRNKIYKGSSEEWKKVEPFLEGKFDIFKKK